MQGLVEKYGAGRVFKVCNIILMVILIGLTIALYNSKKTYNYNGHRLRLVSVDENSIVMSDENSNKLVMSVYSGVPASLVVDMQCEIKYLDKTINYASSLYDMEMVYDFSDGSSLTEPLVIVQVNGIEEDSDLSELQSLEKKLVSKLLDYYRNNIPGYIFIGYNIFGLLFLLLGTGLFFYPEEFWKFQTILSVRNGEPTDWAIFSNKFGGMVIVVLVYIGLLYILGIHGN